MKVRTVLNILIIFMIASVLIYAVSTGITGVTLKGSNPGCICHGTDPAAAVIVTINGPDQMLPNQTDTFTVTITGGPLHAGGTDIAASSGTLDPLGDDLQKISGELTHTLPKLQEQGIVTFKFTYTAPPEPQTVTLFANGNSVNFNGNNFGDQWNYAPNKSIIIQSLADIKDNIALHAFRLDQNYPNPFNPSTKIRYTVPDLISSTAGSARSHVLLKIYDELGSEAAVLVNEDKAPGIYEVVFNAGPLPSGVYYYVLKANNFSETKKMMLLK